MSSFSIFGKTNMAELLVHNALDNKAFPKFALPQEIGCFSLDSDRQFVDSDVELKVYDTPTLGERRRT